MDEEGREPRFFRDMVEKSVGRALLETVAANSMKVAMRESVVFIVTTLNFNSNVKVVMNVVKKLNLKWC